jgi:predicted metal-dependent HD superfamily phosphohydrolase
MIGISAMNLRDRWQNFPLWTTDAQSVFDRLHQSYSESHRHYHNLAHIQQAFSTLDRLIPRYENPALELAVWFHDAIYDPQVQDNEARSADLAEALLQSFVPNAMLQEIQRLILLTKGHRAEDRPGQLLLDCDLSVLASSSLEYQAYAAGIRREYAWVDEGDYCRGRIEVLREFCDRPWIYYSHTLRRLEPRARQNLIEEIRDLER